MIATPSPWDTEVFGYTVGKIHSDGKRTFSYDVGKLNREKFNVVFVKSDGWVDPYGDIVEAVDHLYDMEFKALEKLYPFGISEMTATSAHMQLAGRAFKDSRFLRDVRLRDHVPEMYYKWLFGKTVWVLKGAEESAFLLPDVDQDGARRISLVAVDERHRGMGVGRLLVSSVLRTEMPATWRVKVSCRNHQAVRFYETVGFRVKNICTAYHIWTDL